MRCFTCCIAIIFIFFITNKGYAQSKSPTTSDTTAAKGSDSVKLRMTGGNFSLDSLRKDSLAAAADTSKTGALERKLGIKISKDALKTVVTATARDSSIMNMKQNLFYLYGNAQVNYEDLQLNAGQVSFSQSTNVITASPRIDSTAKEKDTVNGRVVFVQGKEKIINDGIEYNFKSKRAIVHNARSQYGEGFVFSQQIKRNADETIYGLHSTYTTCALDTPHFGINARKIKVIPGKLIVSGACNIEIEGVPTPLWLPFGLFPISTKQKSGFVIPTYTIEQQRGLGLLNGGYYAYLSDKMDLLTQANIYTKGSYSLSELTTYSNVYHYSGMASFSYAYNKTGEDYELNSSTQKDFMLNWRHQSDGKAIPGQSFNASVQVGSSSFYSNNSTDYSQILNNQYQSNITYSKNWLGTPFALTISALHNQNTATKQINVTLPSINFHVAQINPFQSKKRVGTHWYDKITSSYTMDVLNRGTFYDSTFNLSNMSLNNFQNGIHHAVPVSASYTVLRYINMSFNVNYNEYWYTQRLHTSFDNQADKLDSMTQNGFYTARDFNAGVNFSTRIYGMKLWKKGSLRGIRHVITPNIGLTYRPDFGADPFNYYYRTRLDSTQTLYYQSPYAASIIGIPPIGKQGQVNFGLNNNLQIKVRSSKDTISGVKNVTLIDALGANLSYNPAADSFQWSNIGVNFRTNVLDKINISAAAAFDPYGFNYQEGRRVQEFADDMGQGFARFTTANLSLGTNFHSKPKGGANSPTNSEEYARIMRNAGYNDYVDMNIPWSLNVSYSFSANKNYQYITQRDSLILSQSLTLQGELQVTERWKVTVNTGYNFDYHQLTLTSIDVYRDLHCWAMHLQTIPFGPRKSFNFTLNVKAAALQDLKLVRRRDYRDSPY